MLPEPFVSTALSAAESNGANVEDLFDLGQLWEEATGEELPMGVLIAQKAFVEDRPDDVKVLLNDLKACKHIFAEENSSVAAPLFKLCERRQGIAGVKGNQLQLMTESDDVMQALIRDIQLARHNIEMVFISGSPAAWRTRC